MKTVSITEFRKNIFRLTEDALATGEPIVIQRKDGSLLLRPHRRSTAAERRAQWRRFAASAPAPGNAPDLSPEDIHREREAYWTWDEEPEIDR
ncbi:MAG: type II toxin-antitoxin system Phd/YefM family antitoxin [Caulobacteraceae bacterium]